jgi:hypothetical protein
VSNHNTYIFNSQYTNHCIADDRDNGKRLSKSKNGDQNSQKIHQKSESSGSSILLDYSDFEEEDISSLSEKFEWLIPGEELIHRG